MTCSRRSLTAPAIVFAVLTWVGCVQVASAEDSSRPNIVLILCDDLGYADVGFNGAKDIRTPNLDQLAKAGTVCTSAYVTHPFCGPSRMGLMSGRYAHKFGGPFNLPNSGQGIEQYNKLGIPVGEKLIGKVLQEAGYFTGAIGKWHMGISPEFHPNQRGFDDYYGFLGGGHMYFPEKFAGIFERQSRAGNALINEYCLPLEHNGTRVRETEYITDALSREAARFVSKAATKDEQPFFLYLAYNAPHTPLEAKEEDLSLYDHIKDEKRRTYAAMVHAVDRGVGKVIDTLKSTKVFDNTLIVFLSDNGGKTSQGASNGPLRKGKGSVFEGGFRVPMFVHWPAEIKTGNQYDYPVSALDLYPTFAKLAGATTDNDRELDGIDIWDSLLNGQNPNRKDAIFALRHNKSFSSASAREGDWKAVRATAGPWQLFNVAEDIGEQNDLSTQHPERLESLAKKARQWSQSHTPPAWFDSLKVAKNWADEKMPHYETLFQTETANKRSGKNASANRSRPKMGIAKTNGAKSQTSAVVELYSEDFSTAPKYVIAKGPNDNNISSISFGAGSPATDVPHVAFGQFGGTGQYFENCKTTASVSNGKFEIGSNKQVFDKSRNRTYVTFIDTSAATVGQYNVSFDVSDFQSTDESTSLSLHIYEGSHAHKGYLDMQVTHQAMLPKLAPGAPMIKGRGAKIESVLLDNEIAGNGKYSLNFGISNAGHDGEFLALAWSQVKRQGKARMPSMSIDNLKVARLQSSGETNPNVSALPVGQKGKWELQSQFSDEFNGTTIDHEIWNSNPRRYGAHTWDDENVELKDGTLKLSLVHKPHVRGNQKLFYKSGMLRSHQQTTYGYYEARIKGCSLFPGACPAFWIFSDGRKYDGEIRYCEIDVVELQMNELNKDSGERHPVNHIDMNLHHRLADKDGKLYWVRQNTHPELCKTSWKAPWDPRDDFHVYGCDVTPDKITWYIDGERVGEKPNRYCHLPMNVALTLELRHPHIGWEGYKIFPVPNAATNQGFPTSMEVDYVRVWKRKSN